MSGITYGETPEQSALRLLSLIADPVQYKDKIAEMKKTLELIGSVQSENVKRVADAVAAEKAAEQHSINSANAMAEAQRLNADTEDRRAEIVRRQDQWEANLNVREAAIKKAQDDHSAEIAKFEIYKTDKINDLAARAATLSRREQEHEKRKAELDAREAELNEQARIAAELVARFKK